MVAISQEKSNKRKTGGGGGAQVWTCLLAGSARGGDREAVPHRGGRRGGEGGWNATAECQTLCPDGIITDSSKAALHSSASSLPQSVRIRGKNSTSWEEESHREFKKSPAPIRSDEKRLLGGKQRGLT